MNNMNKLWYSESAGKWLEATPLGNGKLGAMVFGKTYRDTIQFNEDTIWSGVPKDMNNHDSLQYLEKVRELLLAEKFQEAQELAAMTQFCIPHEQPAYQTLCDLEIMYLGQYQKTVWENYPETQNLIKSNARVAKDYKRILDMESGIATVEYKLEDVKYNREYFISEKNNVFVNKVTCNKKNSISISAELFRKFDAEVKILDKNKFALDGKCGLYGSSFYAIFEFCHIGGTSKVIGENIIVENADELLIYVSVATDFRYKDYYKEQCQKFIDEAKKITYDKLKEDHINAHKCLYNRVEIKIENDEDDKKSNKLPMKQRILKVKEGESDLDLVSQYFQFCRYLLITSSREGSLPANLQGIWADSFWPSWDSKFTININLEMNYWPVEVCNLAECHFPLFDLLERSKVKGQETAKIHYGCRGFVAHSNLDLWANTAPIDNVYCGLWPTGAAWLCYHLWESYEHSHSKEFLRDRGYPLMKEAAVFFLDYLIEDEKGQLLCGPSVSPENSFYDMEGYRVGLCMSPTMDTQIIFGLFERCIKASEILDIDEEFRLELKNSITKLPSMKIGKYGQLQEWLEDYEEMLLGHRHISNLFGLYPGTQITPEDTPELAEACRVSLERRINNGSGYVGWSEAWIAALWTRLYEGNKAYNHIKNIFKINTAPNLFDLSPPLPPGNDHEVFQIDGNMGTLASMCEMIIQSHRGEVRLLPCIPEEWQRGYVKGLIARGGFEIDIKWDNNTLETASIISRTGEKCVLSTDVPVIAADKNIESTKDKNGKWVIELDTKIGEKITIITKK